MIALRQPYCLGKANENNVKEGDVYFALISDSSLVPTKIRKVDSTGFSYIGENAETRVLGHKSFDRLDSIIVHKDKQSMLVLTRDSDNYEINREELEELLRQHNFI